jgi:lipopolysaccharide export LptBFGC system permease protein LptF
MRFALLKRQLFLWLAVRALQVPVLLLAAPPGNSIARSLSAPQPAVVLVAAALGVIELRRRHELILMGNLGITRTQVAAILIVPSLLIETVIALLGNL